MSKEDSNLVIVCVLACLLFEGLIRLFNMYNVFPDVDLFSHFIFGFSIYGLYYLIFRKRIFSKLFITALFWEIFEISTNRIFVKTSKNILLSLFAAGGEDRFFFDGATDVILFMVGGLIAYWVWWKPLEEKNKLTKKV